MCVFGHICIDIIKNVRVVKCCRNGLHFAKTLLLPISLYMCLHYQMIFFVNHFRQYQKIIKRITFLFTTSFLFYIQQKNITFLTGYIWL